MSELKWPQEEKLSNKAELQSAWDFCIPLQRFLVRPCLRRLTLLGGVCTAWLRVWIKNNGPGSAAARGTEGRPLLHSLANSSQKSVCFSLQMLQFSTSSNVLAPLYFNCRPECGDFWFLALRYELLQAFKSEFNEHSLLISQIHIRSFIFPVSHIYNATPGGAKSRQDAFFQV